MNSITLVGWIPLGFIILTEKRNFGRFWLRKIDPMGIGFPFGLTKFFLLNLILRRFITLTKIRNFYRFLLRKIYPLGIGIPLGFIAPTGKWNFNRFWLGKINPLGIGISLGFITPTGKWNFSRFWLGKINPLGIGISLGFITPTEKSNLGRFWLGKINPMGINQLFTFEFNSFVNWNPPGIYYTNWKMEFWSILTWEKTSHGSSISLVNYWMFQSENLILRKRIHK